MITEIAPVNTKALVPVKSARQLFGSGSLSLLKSMDDVRRLAGLYAQSRFFSDASEMAQAAVKIIYGMDLGFHPTASMTGIYIVKSRVTLSANMMAALINRSGTHRYRPVKISGTECNLLFQFRNDDNKWENIGNSIFTIEDAKQAGILGDTYRKYPRNMLFARAMSNGAKWFVPECFHGVTPYLPEEVDDSVSQNEEGEYSGLNTLQPAPLPEGTRLRLEIQLQELIKNTGTDAGAMLGYYKAETLANLSTQLFQALDNLETKFSKQQKEAAVALQIPDAEIVASIPAEATDE